MDLAHSPSKEDWLFSDIFTGFFLMVVPVFTPFAQRQVEECQKGNGGKRNNMRNSSDRRKKKTMKGLKPPTERDQSMVAQRVCLHTGWAQPLFLTCTGKQRFPGHSFPTRIRAATCHRAQPSTKRCSQTEFPHSFPSFAIKQEGV